jgi:hypothetical protein
MERASALLADIPGVREVRPARAGGPARLAA